MRERATSVSVWAALFLLGGVWVSRPGPADRPIAPVARPASGAVRLLHGLPIDPARESAWVLEVLPGIGPGRARAIVREREREPLCRLSDLLRVPGIGPATLRTVTPYLEIGPQMACASLSSRANAPSGPQEPSHERTGTSRRGNDTAVGAVRTLRAAEPAEPLREGAGLRRAQPVEPRATAGAAELAPGSGAARRGDR